MTKIFSSLQHQRVLVFGLGQFGGGTGTVRWLIQHGAQVVVSDRRSAPELRASLREISRLRFEKRFGKQSTGDLENIDLVIANPGIPRDHPVLMEAQKRKIPVANIATLFFANEVRPIIGVTGTRGKSTTSHIIAALLKASGHSAALVGQPGTSLLDEGNKKKKLLVAELSSWQLEGLKVIKRSPSTAVVTNISPDHLNRYRSLHHYASAKKNIVRYQNANGVAVLPFFDRRVRQWSNNTPGKVLWFSGQRGVRQGVGVEGGWFLERYGKHVRKLSHVDVQLHPHMRENIAAALTAVIPFQLPLKDIRTVLQHLPILPGRQEIISRGLQRLWVNDTTATSPEGVRAALESLPRPIILIAGGQDKGLHFHDLARFIVRRVQALVVLPGSASEKLLRALPRSYRSHITHAATMQVAVREAFACSKNRSTILLSPGAASFNLFRHEFDRGEQFTTAVRTLVKHHEKKR